jgi:hypothetical protein
MSESGYQLARTERPVENGEKTELSAVKSDLLSTARLEVKYRMDAEGAKRLRSQMIGRLMPKRVHGVASSYRISIYLDTKDRHFSRAELETVRPSIKMRVRDYYHMDGEFPVFKDVCFVEMKRRDGQMVEKYRLCVPREVVSETVKQGAGLFLNDTVGGDGADTKIECPADSLAAVFAVHYRRFSLEDRAAGLRITFDDSVSYHTATGVPQPALYRYPALSKPFLVDPARIVEVKSLAALPSWLTEILAGQKQSRQSKFGIGVRELERRKTLFQPV